MSTFFALACLLAGLQLASSTFWPFVPGPNPFASLFQAPAAQPQSVYQQPAVQYPQAQQYHQYSYQQAQPQPQPQSPCSGRKRREAVMEADLSEMLNPVCKSQKLSTLMLENMSSNTDESTRSIQLAVKKLGDFDVFCANGDLSLSVSSKLFCKEKFEDVTCYAFSSHI